MKFIYKNITLAVFDERTQTVTVDPKFSSQSYDQDAIMGLGTFFVRAENAIMGLTKNGLPDIKVACSQ